MKNPCLFFLFSCFDSMQSVLNYCHRQMKTKGKTMSKRTKQETIEYFNQLSWEYEKSAAREEHDKIAKAKYEAKAEAYKIAAFELTHNMI